MSDRRKCCFLFELLLLVVLQQTSNAAETVVPESRQGQQGPKQVSVQSPVAVVPLYRPRPESDFAVFSHAVRVPAGQTLPFQSAWTDDGRLTAEIGGRTQVIAARVKWIGSGDSIQLQNPLASMSDDQIAGLWGVLIEAWTDEVEQQLHKIDRELALITVTGDWRRESTSPLPPIPRDVRYLRMVMNSSESEVGEKDQLNLLTDLRYFSLRSPSNQAFDFQWLSNCAKLETVVVGGLQLKNLGALSSLLQIRHLDFARQRQHLREINFVAKLAQLETLDISMSAVTSLESLSGLKHLRWVNADATMVEALPEKLTAGVLRIQSTRLSEQQVSQFSAANPRCFVAHRWGELLRHQVGDAAKLVVRRLHVVTDPDGHASSHLYESHDRAEIQALVDGIEINEAQSGFHCMCEGEPFLDFYDGDKLLATVGFHHGRSLRWVPGWWGDAMLTPASGQFLVNWLNDRGVTGPADEIRRSQEYQRAADRKLKRAIAGLPKRVANAFAQRSTKFGESLRAEYPDRLQQINALLRIYGTSNNSWTQLEWIEQFADEELKKYAERELALAVESALLGSDRQVRRGAARYWHSWGTTLKDWNPDNVADLRLAVVQVMQDSHYYPLRLESQRYVQSYHKDFAEETLLEIVKRGLRDPHPSVRRSAMLTSGILGLHQLTDHLMRVLRGEETAIAALPNVPEDEQVDVAKGFDDVAGKRSQPEVAALALGYLGHPAAAPLIRDMAKSSPMYEVALALLGDHGKLKPIHFQLDESNVALQLAAIRVVIDTRGAIGLKWATEYQQSQYWWEEEVVASLLSQMLIAEDAPGAAALTNCTDLEDVAQWYQQHGEDYVRQAGKRLVQE